MKIPQLSKETGSLVARVGNGLQWLNDNGELMVSYRQRPAVSGLVLHATFDGEPLTLLVDEEQWCQWVQPMLTVPSLAMTPPEFRDLLSIWTLADAGECCENNSMAWPQSERLEAGSAEPQMGWHVYIRREERELGCYLLSGAEKWVSALSDEAFPVSNHDTATDIKLCVSLLAGWSKVESSILNILGPGDALILQHSWQVADDQYGLFIDRPIATLRQEHEPNTFTLEEIMNDFDDWMDVTPSPSFISSQRDTLLNTTFAVTVEVAKFEVSLQELSQLDVGGQLSGTTQYDGLVTLKVGGLPFAKGTLLEIDSRLAVRIESIC
ncbi:type III secretion system cytoplasmic ring protein SctQ [Rouxiella badensis]|jgi:type III secretion protein Q|uniref:type III secretion system cytoplasmic ring protein SctQ n=1 Tax=Rouxiella badensis TaxID=1646377 RepID=UPI0013EF5429|nr:type III secretion system cytoplasmic ring protein SctQ [Rouxiella badensis]QII37836.1 type III secretion system cytoplasmic ring protein SctQ [Rouxiella badensis]WAT10082.1 type III secretion system cytoplasmic ring protein SctQ [Rouxiella badensis]